MHNPFFALPVLSTFGAKGVQFNNCPYRRRRRGHFQCKGEVCWRATAGDAQKYSSGDNMLLGGLLTYRVEGVGDALSQVSFAMFPSSFCLYKAVHFLFFSESLRDQVRARKLKPNGDRGDGRTSGGRTWGMQVAKSHKCRSGRRSRLSFAAAVKLRMPLEGGCTTTPLDVNVRFGGKRERYTQNRFGLKMRGNEESSNTQEQYSRT
ncbi:uncharacterized protein BDZ83DRAFT_606936 [Colletotrichum acutatum]|uniref:Uncharacterized protein n=1 Tax=Glomerella acutata TaxID=27357 RepID=A0AAD8XKQ2_GLOAC|nr:uncharacterized protein BDZ83DRAFT_606936 [Colletotrichum acutatum]KAK1729155.1 hypothetical protein BDZ83DRAFT_606936 [Colletotrichum acutatum]